MNTKIKYVKKAIHSRISKEKYKKLMKECNRKGLTISSMIDECIDKYFERKELIKLIEKQRVKLEDSLEEKCKKIISELKKH